MGCSPQGYKESDMTEQMSTCVYPHLGRQINRYVHRLIDKLAALVVSGKGNCWLKDGMGGKLLLYTLMYFEF